MAVVNTKTSRVTNSDASPRVLDTPNVNHGRLRRVVGTLEAVSGDSIGSTYRMARVHSSWCVVDMYLYCDAITTCAGDVGLYRIAADGGAVVDADAYASAASLATASTTGINVAYEARDIIKCQQQVWQDAGATADTGYWYDVVITLTAAAGSAGSLVLDIGYVAND